jgi:hypothetical protein
VPFLLWSHRAAHAQGVAVDLQKLTEWDQWAIKDSLAHRNSFRLPKADLEKIDATTLPAAVKDKVKPIVDQAFANEAEFLQKLTPLLTDEELKTHQAVLVNAARLPLYAVDRTGGGLDVLGQLLLGSDQTAQDSTAEPGRNIDGSDHHEFHRGVIELMNRLQLADGSWTPGNQLATMRKWSLPAANQATTMWATLALEAYHARDQRSPKQSEQIERAVAYQRQQPPQAGNREWLATRLLFERQFGTPDEVSKFR